MAGKVSEIEGFDPHTMVIYIMAVKDVLDPPEIICRWNGSLTLTAVSRAIKAASDAYVAAFGVICYEACHEVDGRIKASFKVMDKEYTFDKIFSFDNFTGIPKKNLSDLRKMSNNDLT